MHTSYKLDELLGRPGADAFAHVIRKPLTTQGDGPSQFIGVASTGELVQYIDDARREGVAIHEMCLAYRPQRVIIDFDGQGGLNDEAVFAEVLRTLEVELYELGADDDAIVHVIGDRPGKVSRRIYSTQFFRNGPTAEAIVDAVKKQIARRFPDEPIGQIIDNLHSKTRFSTRIPYTPKNGVPFLPPGGLPSELDADIIEQYLVMGNLLEPRAILHAGVFEREFVERRETSAAVDVPADVRAIVETGLQEIGGDAYNIVWEPTGAPSGILAYLMRREPSFCPGHKRVHERHNAYVVADDNGLVMILCRADPKEGSLMWKQPPAREAGYDLIDDLMAALGEAPPRKLPPASDADTDEDDKPLPYYEFSGMLRMDKTYQASEFISLTKRAFGFVSKTSVPTWVTCTRDPLTCEIDYDITNSLEVTAKHKYSVAAPPSAAIKAARAARRSKIVAKLTADVEKARAAKLARQEKRRAKIHAKNKKKMAAVNTKNQTRRARITAKNAKCADEVSARNQKRMGKLTTEEQRAAFVPEEYTPIIVEDSEASLSEFESSGEELPDAKVDTDSEDDIPEVIVESLRCLIERYRHNYEYSDVGCYFYPPGSKPSAPLGVFNTFRGFRAIPRSDSNLVAPIIAHITDVWCAGDSALSVYVLNWLAHMLQFPSRKSGTALLLRSQQGAGKNLITDWFCDFVLGPRYSLSLTAIDKVLGRFNGCLENKKLIVLNEASLSGDFHNANNALKGLVTESHLVIEKKGLEPRVVHFAGEFMLLSNHSNPIRIESSDRRFVCIDVSNHRCGDREYFKALAEALGREGAADAFAAALMARDLTQWSPADIPDTTMKKEMRIDGLPSAVRFVLECIQTKRVFEPIDGVLEVPVGDLYDSYSSWCKANNEKVKASSYFGRDLSHHNIATRRRCRRDGGRQYMYEITPENLQTVDKFIDRKE